MIIYLDNAASTKVHDKALDLMLDMMIKNYGNPSSIHKMGLDAEKKLKSARKTISNCLGFGDEDGDLVFTSGGTESNNLTIRGIHLKKDKKYHFITSSIEHPSVSECFKKWEEDGHEVTYLPVDHDGLVSFDDLKQAIRDNTILVSIMHVNNETGTVQDIEKLVQITKEINKECLFHSDGVQAFGKIDVNVKSLGVDLYSISSHKIHGTKGSGAVYIKKGVKLHPIIYGSGHEKGYRAGTENIVGIVGFEYACEYAKKNLLTNMQQLENLRKRFWNGLSSKLDYISINGSLYTSAAHIINIAFENMRAEVIVHEIASYGVMASTGAACSSKKKIYSKVLTAMNISDSKKQGSIRFSFNPYMTYDEIDRAVDIIVDAVNRLAPMMRG